MVQTKSSKYGEFERLMSLFDAFWDFYFKDKWPFKELSGSSGRNTRADAKLLMYLFFLWLESEGGRLYLPGSIQVSGS